MNVNYSKEQVKSMVYHLTQIATILGDVQPGTLIAPIDLGSTTAKLSVTKFLKIMGYEDCPEAENPEDYEEERLDEEYDEKQFEKLCGHWTPWVKKQLPDIIISKICKGKYLLKIIDNQEGSEYASAKLDSNDYGNIFFMLMGEEITLEYYEPEIDEFDSIQIKRTTYLRKKD